MNMKKVYTVLTAETLVCLNNSVRYHLKNKCVLIGDVGINKTSNNKKIYSQTILKPHANI